MSKNLSNYKLNQNLSQVQKDLATQSSIAETGYLRSQRQDSKIQNTAQEKIDAIQLEIESRGNPSKVAGSIIGNLGKIINYFFGNAKEPETIDPNPKDQKVEQDLQEKKIEKKLDEIVEKKRKVGSIREFYVRHHHGFYYEKPMMSLENSELREKFKEQKLIIDRKEGPITTAELSKYAETLLNLNLNLKGCGELNSSSDFRQIRKEIKKLSDLSEKTFTDLEKLNQTSDSQFQLGFLVFIKINLSKPLIIFQKPLS